MYIQVHNTTNQYSTISLHVHTGIQYNQSVQYNLSSCTYRYTIQPDSLVQSPFMYIQAYSTTSRFSTISHHVHTDIQYNQSVHYNLPLHVHTGIQYNQSVQYNLPSCTYRHTIQPVSTLQSPPLCTYRYTIQSPFIYIQV